MENVVKINYTFELPLNDAFMDAYKEYLEMVGKENEGLRANLVNDFLLAQVQLEIEKVVLEYPKFKGQFISEIKETRITGIFRGDGMIPMSRDEKIRQGFEDVFRRFLGDSRFRVDINLGCEI